MTDLAAIRTAARQQLWREGRAAEYLLDTSGPSGGQRAWVARLDEAPPSTWTAWRISRQRGKTFAVLVWALQRMGLARLSVVYLAQTGSNALAIIKEFLREIEPDLPPEWGARIDEQHSELLCNGSALAFFGTDNQQFKRRRGRKADIVLLDEAGFYSDLEDVEQVYVAQLQTTGGIGLYLCSPAISPAHPFSTRCKQAQAAGRFEHDTFWSNPRINHEAVIAGEMARLNLTREQLLASTAFRREFLAEEVTEESRAAMPSWNQALHAQVVGEWTRPEHWDGYQGGDAGLTADPHAWLWAWHDPATNTLTIEDELELPSISNTIASLARDVKAKETALYGVNSWNGLLLGTDDWRRQFGELPEYLTKGVIDGAPRQPYLRIGDNAAGLCKEMSLAHGIGMLPTDRHDKALHVDAANQLLGTLRVRIHSRCVRLIEQLYTTVWNKARSEWERTAKDHGDLIDCLVYLLRNVRWHRDCRPKHADAAERYKAEALRKVQPKAQGWNFGGRR